MSTETGKLQTSPSGGMKFDGGKTSYDLLPLQALKGMAEVMTFGASKYAAYNWQEVELPRYLSAMQRHLDALLFSDEDVDPDSGLHHAWHFATDAVFAAWLMVFRPEQRRAYGRVQRGEK